MEVSTTLYVYTQIRCKNECSVNRKNSICIGQLENFTQLQPLFRAQDLDFARTAIKKRLAIFYLEVIIRYIRVWQLRKITDGRRIFWFFSHRHRLSRCSHICRWHSMAYRELRPARKCWGGKEKASMICERQQISMFGHSNVFCVLFVQTSMSIARFAYTSLKQKLHDNRINGRIWV